jgi:hypothetical protein
MCAGSGHGPLLTAPPCVNFRLEMLLAAVTRHGRLLGACGQREMGGSAPRERRLRWVPGAPSMLQSPICEANEALE